MIVVGCDVGSLTGKAVVLEDDVILSYSIVPATTRPETTARIALDQALAERALSPGDIGYIVGTGYGRAKIPFARANVSEITCHGVGAHWIDPSIRTVLDVGGQDCKVIALDAEGNVDEFAMNDKCAAGTGRFLEGVARVLDLQLEQLGPLSGESASPVAISSQCSVFAESEVVAQLNDGAEIADIVAGVHRAIAARLASMVRRIEPRKEIAVVGGVAKNAGVVGFLEQELGPIRRIEIDPQICGALGAALLAAERLAREPE